MKVRKLAVALALAGGLGSGVAQALGLGEIELQSYLNEPLDAEINLRKSEGVSPGDVFVNIAPESAYERVGIDRSFFLTKLDFEVTTAPNGSLVVNVSSREPLREPYLNFLIEVTWPNGRLMREYAVLVDPPVYAEESGVDEQVAAPATADNRQPQQQRQPAPAETSRATGQGRSSGSRTLGPTNSADTLWTISAQIRPNNDVTMQQVMLAVQDLNPDAFIGGNINRLKRGEILRIPDENQIRSRSRAEASREVAAQNASFSSPQRTVDATPAAAADQPTETAGGSGGDQLRLLAADDTQPRDAADGGSAGGDGDTAGGADAGSAVAMEELESARRENEELTGRVDDLQDQVETLQRLLELKNTQLAEMQSGQQDQQISDAAPEEDPVAGADETAVTDAAEDRPVAVDEAAPEATDEDVGADTAIAVEPETDAVDAADTEAPGMDDESGAADAEEQAVTGQQEAVEPEQPAAVPAAVPADQAPAQKPFPGNIIDAISNNFMYQVALGGGLVVLLLLLLALARRNANREKAFYDQLNNDTSESENDSFDLSFEEEEGDAVADDDDAIAEADAYIAYGRNDQAAHTLETAISREPSRTDLRLKLLGVYADVQDRESFDKQFREIEALDDEAATAEARDILDHLEEAESMPSIDDLESQLRSDGTGDEEATSFESEYDIQDYEAPRSDEPENDTDTSPDFGDLELDLPGSGEEQRDAAEPDESLETSEDTRDDLIEYDLSDLESAESEKSAEGEKKDELDEPFDFSLEDTELTEGGETEAFAPLETDSGSDAEDDLSLEFETSELEDSDGDDLDLNESDLEDGDFDTSEFEESTLGESSREDTTLDEIDLEEPEVEVTAEPEAGDAVPPADKADDFEDELALDADGELDESFLDELDAELDKVAEEDDTDMKEGESDLDDLELDVSDEDLALMEEFSESSDEGPADAPEKAEDTELSLDDELGLEDALSGEEPSGPAQEVDGAEQADEAVSEAGTSDVAEESDEDAGIPPVASDHSADSDRDIDETDLGDDDDFDFLSGTDEAATKLDLARAYVEMGDVDGARDILEEVALEGNDEQKAEAQDLLKNLS